ncbi:UPAR/Ly6 domain-containing protein crim [Prorops nasuta]|uniref:UPAR/Ly6 domain-containing protein crim n=1 Tax=Prorops nasuta TaxID=863751 RepID=UPI0034D00185
MSFKVICVIFVLSLIMKEGQSLYCYRCNSNQPGCGTPFNWLWYWGETCPEYDDKCVKLVERKGAETIITRECLSSLRGFRTDIPADRYEGCRPAAKDPHLSNYVFNNIDELDIYRNHYDNVTWCFCYFDNRCNGAISIKISIALLTSLLILHQLVL